jgi:transcriptional regulator with XRE-family HTH domain
MATFTHASSATKPTIGSHLRDWRQRRRLSQLDLACEANISPRHLSFVETGRSTPSREMILHLAEQLQIPMRERNVLLVAAGYAPVFVERSLDDPALAAMRKAIDLVLQGHLPYPAFALNRHWQVVSSNHALPQIYEGVAPELLVPPVNVMRLSLHPKGLAPRIANLAQWRAHLLARLHQQIDLTADPVLVDLMHELAEYPGSQKAKTHMGESGNVIVPFRLSVAAGTLSFFSTTMIFGTPLDITLAELAVESFFPADASTIEIVRRMTDASTADHLLPTT